MPLNPLAVALSAVALGLGLGACGGGGSDDSPEDIQAELAEQFQDEGLDEAAAECFAEVLVEEIGADELADIDFSDEAPPEELQEELAAAARIAIDRCDIDPERPTG